MKYVHASLFSGIGGPDIAAEWMGWENAFHCEWNPFGQRVLKHYFPNSVSYGNIKETDFSFWRRRIDVLSGGFPCQPYSQAGNRKGKEDDRHLWPEMLRAIREIQPIWVVGENVFGLVNWSDGLVFHEVQADLEAEGYEVFPYVLPAASLNAPHRRDRVWFVAYSKRNDDLRTASYTSNSGRGRREDKEHRDKYWGGVFSEESKGSSLWSKAPRRSRKRITSYSESWWSRGIRYANEASGSFESYELFGGEFGMENSKRITLDPNLWSRQEHELRSGGGLSENDFNEKWSSSDCNSDGQKFSDSEYEIRSGKRRFNALDDSEPIIITDPVISGFEIEGKFTEPTAQNWRTGDCSGGWLGFPYQSPLCSGDDGLPSELDGITFSKWRTESIMAYGNAIVPQVIYQLFETIEEFNRLWKVA